MDNFSQNIDKFGEYGEVVQVNYPIASIIGLPSARLNEIVLFETGDKGKIISLHEDIAHVLLFSQDKPRTKTKVGRTNSFINIPLGKDLLGHIINPFGQPLSASQTAPQGETSRPIDVPPQGIGERFP